ncbi:glycosyl transferase [Proteus mirabilis]|uniref:Glycosyl transferase n=1 Tax=Proteus mirabilis TaxID=584 RepID=A0A379EZK9_PROMI|nr:glycosyl transferase [Proteus mirabilis]
MINLFITIALTLNSITRKPNPQKEAKRAQSYLQIVIQLLQLADKQHQPLLANALRQQALRELGSFFILFRKRCDTKNQTIIAQQFRTYHLFPALNKGAKIGINVGLFAVFIAFFIGIVGKKDKKNSAKFSAVLLIK